MISFSIASLMAYHGLIAVSVMFPVKKLELSRTIKDKPPAEPSFKVKI